MEAITSNSALEFYTQLKWNHRHLYPTLPCLSGLLLLVQPCTTLISAHLHNFFLLQQRPADDYKLSRSHFKMQNIGLALYLPGFDFQILLFTTAEWIIRIVHFKVHLKLNLQVIICYLCVNSLSCSMFQNKAPFVFKCIGDHAFASGQPDTRGKQKSVEVLQSEHPLMATYGGGL